MITAFFIMQFCIILFCITLFYITEYRSVVGKGVSREIFATEFSPQTRKGRVSPRAAVSTRSKRSTR